MQQLYERSSHAEAAAALEKLMALHERLGKPAVTRNLLDLYRLDQGPIVTTLDNRREPFLPVARETPGKNVYPADAAEQVEIVPRSPTGATRRNPRGAFSRAARDGHEHQRRYCDAQALRPDPRTASGPARESPGTGKARVAGFVLRGAVSHCLSTGNDARLRVADAGGGQDRALGHRVRALPAQPRPRPRFNDYETGDASWVTGRFTRLNAQIGAYETYDDALFGVKAFHSMSILLRDEAATQELRKALGGIQSIEDALPYEPRKRVRDDIPVGVYDVIADFGQARGTNTATILPNDALFSRRYGRTILLRDNIMKNPDALRLRRARLARRHGRRTCERPRRRGKLPAHACGTRSATTSAPIATTRTHAGRGARRLMPTRWRR